MPAVWAIADLHLALGVPEKHMGAFGPQWTTYTEDISREWKAFVAPEDLVLIAGDISWAMRLEDAKIDLDWIDKLPGTKVMIRGNHDYWWSSPSKIAKILPPSLHLIQNTSFVWGDVAIAGTRLWDTPEYNFGKYIDYKPNPKAKQMEQQVEDPAETERIFERELGRLELSLKSLPVNAKTKIAMTHYPPIGPEWLPSRTSTLLKKYGVEICVFGHLHNIKPNIVIEGQSEGIQYFLTACDYLKWKPLKIL